MKLDGTPNVEGQLFVDGYFNVRRIGGRGSGGGPTPPPTPPPPNP